ncbi:MAG: phage baseplate assembly protein V [Candidatus Eremiobacteraeota bacterium]|nr:phage baseplate assembly protein V [Candidatus Eremiobacteraeota bacterium]
MQDDIQRFYGKYRGVVTETADPASLGRIKVKLENYPGWKDNWCMPCVPYAGDNVGWFVVPEAGAHVWVEFEGGDPDRAIWAGCFWDAGTIPATATPSRKVWKTQTCTLVLDDLDGKAGQLEIDVKIREGQALKIRMNEAGIKLTAGTAVITMAVDDDITIESPSAKVTLTEDE